MSTVWPVVGMFSVVWVQSINTLLYLENHFEIRLRKSSQVKKFKKDKQISHLGPLTVWWYPIFRSCWPSSHTSAVPAVGQWPGANTLELSVPIQWGCQSLHPHSVNKPLCIIWREQPCLVNFDTDTTWDLQFQPFCVCLVNNTGQMEPLEK